MRHNIVDMPMSLQVRDEGSGAFFAAFREWQCSGHRRLTIAQDCKVAGNISSWCVFDENTEQVEAISLLENVCPFEFSR